MTEREELAREIHAQGDAVWALAKRYEGKTDLRDYVDHLKRSSQHLHDIAAALEGRRA